MNNLKTINDSQGHDAGDTAIKTVAVCLVKNRSKTKMVYRIGGLLRRDNGIHSVYT